MFRSAQPFNPSRRAMMRSYSNSSKRPSLAFKLALGTTCAVGTIVGFAYAATVNDQAHELWLQVIPKGEIILKKFKKESSETRDRISNIGGKLLKMQAKVWAKWSIPSQRHWKEVGGKRLKSRETLKKVLNLLRNPSRKPFIRECSWFMIPTQEHLKPFQALKRPLAMALKVHQNLFQVFFTQWKTLWAINSTVTSVKTTLGLPIDASLTSQMNSKEPKVSLPKDVPEMKAKTIEIVPGNKAKAMDTTKTTAIKTESIQDAKDNAIKVETPIDTKNDVLEKSLEEMAVVRPDDVPVNSKVTVAGADSVSEKASLECVVVSEKVASIESKPLEKVVEAGKIVAESNSVAVPKANVSSEKSSGTNPAVLESVPAPVASKAVKVPVPVVIEAQEVPSIILKQNHSLVQLHEQPLSLEAY
jgi:hypothetical protein